MTVQCRINRIFDKPLKPFLVLSPRELQICEGIVLGKSSTAISLELGIAQSTVDTYRRRAYVKLNISSQNELFSLCIQALEDDMQFRTEHFHSQVFYTF